MFTKVTIAQNVVDYSSVINYTYTGEKVYAGDVNNDTYTDIVLYNSNVNPHTVKVLMSNGQANSLQYNYNNAWDITLTAGEEVWEVKDADGDGDVDVYTKKPNGNDWDINVRENLNNNFNTIHVLGNVSIDYNVLGTINYDASGQLDFYCANTNSNANNNIVIKTVNSFAFSTTKTFVNINTNTFIGTAKVHFFTGHFTQNATEELLYVKETISVNNSNYLVQTINESAGYLALGFNMSYGGPPSQQFFVGDFTNGDTYSDIAIFITGGYYIYMLENSTGNAFANSLTTWKSGFSGNAVFAKSAGNFATNFSKSDMLLIQTAPQGTPDLGEVYLEQNTNNNTFGQIELIEKPCGYNPVKVASNEYRILPIQMDNTDADDYILWNASISFLKVATLKTVSPPQNAPIYEGYSWPMSVTQGGSLNFYIKNTEVADINIYRYESRGVSVLTIPTNASTYTIAFNAQANNITNVVTQGCGWTSNYSLTINPNWESGYYVAYISDQVCINSYNIPFIVKNSTINAKKLALLANTNTWAAYNRYTNNANINGSKYDNPDVTQHRDFSLMRPLSGMGLNIASNERPHLARAELWIYTWLKDYLGYAPDVVTDIDLHLNNFNLNNYEYFVMGTHPEYWTGTMYNNVKNFQTYGNNGNGGNLICIGGNAVFEVVDLDLNNPNNPLLKVYPDGPGGATTQ